MKLSVRKVCQTSSGGDHVTIYDSDMELTDKPNCVEVKWPPENEDSEDLRRALQAIAEGARSVLQPLGHGAVITLTRIVIHPVDFKPRRFEQHTMEEVNRLMAG